MKAVYENATHLDKRAKESYFLSEDILMEHAALALMRTAIQHVRSGNIHILCGPGNNGADGIACARLLQVEGVSVSISIPLGVKSPMAILQLERALALGIEVVDLYTGNADVIIDALFGSGLSRRLDEKSESLIKHYNEITAFKIACDFPSGLFNDGRYGVIFQADATVSMGALKKAYFYDHTKDPCGKIIHADLGLSYEKYIAETDTFLLEKSDMKLPNRSVHNSHKGTYGHVAVLEGAMPGAPTLCALAALEFGAGLVSVVGYARHDYPPMIMHATHIPENTSVLALGMGMGESYEDQDILEMCSNLPLVVDADLFSHPLIRQILESASPKILTPHPKEFATLLNLIDGKDSSVESILEEKFSLSREFSKRYPNAVLILKGTNTIIAYKGNVFISSMGTPALAKGGSGDVLAGMLASLIAQKYSILDAAITAVIAHSISAKNYSDANYSFTPIKLIEGLGKIG